MHSLQIVLQFHWFQKSNSVVVLPVSECDRVPSAGSAALSVEEEQQQPTSHHIQAVCSEKFVVLTSVMDCNSNKESSARTSDEVQLVKEETQCRVTRSSPVEQHRQVTVNVETETQCDIPQADPSPSADTCLPPAVQQRISPQVMESLQLVQRSEVVLRVNAATSDAASQTESEREMMGVVVSPLIRQKLQEEIECERLSLDLANHLPPSDKLQGLLGTYCFMYMYIKLFLCLYTMKSYQEVEVKLHLALDGQFHSLTVIPQGRVPQYYWMGGWVRGSQNWLGFCDKDL
jgi:hypothetical protein